MKSGTKSNNATAATANRFRIRTANNNNNNTKNIAASSKRPSSSTGQQQQKRPPLEVYSSNNMNAAGGTSMNDGTCKSANPVNKTSPATTSRNALIRKDNIAPATNNNNNGILSSSKQGNSTAAAATVPRNVRRPTAPMTGGKQQRREPTVDGIIDIGKGKMPEKEVEAEQKTDPEQQKLPQSMMPMPSTNAAAAMVELDIEEILWSRPIARAEVCPTNMPPFRLRDLLEKDVQVKAYRQATPFHKWHKRKYYYGGAMSPRNNNNKSGIGTTSCVNGCMPPPPMTKMLTANGSNNNNENYLHFVPELLDWFRRDQVLITRRWRALGADMCAVKMRKARAQIASEVPRHVFDGEANQYQHYPTTVAGANGSTGGRAHSIGSAASGSGTIARVNNNCRERTPGGCAAEMELCDANDEHKLDEWRLAQRRKCRGQLLVNLAKPESVDQLADELEADEHEEEMVRAVPRSHWTGERRLAVQFQNLCLLPALEPLYMSVALYDVRMRLKLSEDFHIDSTALCHHHQQQQQPGKYYANSYGSRSRGGMLICRRALFTLPRAVVDAEEGDEGLALVFRLEMALQRGGLDATLEPYIKRQQQQQADECEHRRGGGGVGGRGIVPPLPLNQHESAFRQQVGLIVLPLAQTVANAEAAATAAATQNKNNGIGTAASTTTTNLPTILTDSFHNGINGKLQQQQKCHHQHSDTISVNSSSSGSAAGRGAGRTTNTTDSSASTVGRPSSSSWTMLPPPPPFSTNDLAKCAAAHPSTDGNNNDSDEAIADRNSSSPLPSWTRFLEHETLSIRIGTFWKCEAMCEADMFDWLQQKCIAQQQVGQQQQQEQQQFKGGGGGSAADKVPMELHIELVICTLTELTVAQHNNDDSSSRIFSPEHRMLAFSNANGIGGEGDGNNEESDEDDEAEDEEEEWMARLDGGYSQQSSASTSAAAAVPIIQDILPLPVTPHLVRPHRIAHPHVLFIRPRAVNFAAFSASAMARTGGGGIGGGNAKQTSSSARNICVRAELFDGQMRPVPAFCVDTSSSSFISATAFSSSQQQQLPSATARLSSWVQSSVQYHCKAPCFGAGGQNEWKLLLPRGQQLADGLHLRFTFLHVSCRGSTKEEAGGTSVPSSTGAKHSETAIGYSWLPLCAINSTTQPPAAAAAELSSMPPTGHQHLPIALDPLPPAVCFLSPQLPIPGVRWLDGRRPVFHVQLQLVSSLWPPDLHLQHFLHCSQRFRMANQQNAENQRNAVDDMQQQQLCQSIRDLLKTQPEPMLAYLHILLHRLLAILLQTATQHDGIHQQQLAQCAFDTLCQLAKIATMLLDVGRADRWGRSRLLVDFVRLHALPSLNGTIGTSDQKKAATTTTTVSDVNGNNNAERMMMVNRTNNNIGDITPAGMAWRQTAQDCQNNQHQHKSTMIGSGSDGGRTATATTKNPLSPQPHQLMHELLVRLLLSARESARDTAYTFCWFPLALIHRAMAEHLVRSEGVLLPRKMRFRAPFLTQLDQLGEALATELLEIVPRNLAHAQAINNAWARFLRDLVSIVCRKFVLGQLRKHCERIDAKIRELQSASSVSSASQQQLLTLKLAFMRILYAHEHFMFLCLPFADLPSSSATVPSSSAASSNIIATVKSQQPTTTIVGVPVHPPPYPSPHSTSSSGKPAEAANHRVPNANATTSAAKLRRSASSMSTATTLSSGSASGSNGRKGMGVRGAAATGANPTTTARTLAKSSNSKITSSSSVFAAPTTAKPLLLSAAPAAGVFRPGTATSAIGTSFVKSTPQQQQPLFTTLCPEHRRRHFPLALLLTQLQDSLLPPTNNKTNNTEAVLVLHNCVDLLHWLMCAHEMDWRLRDMELRQQVARMYAPLLGIVLEWIGGGAETADDVIDDDAEEEEDEGLGGLLLFGRRRSGTTVLAAWRNGAAADFDDEPIGGGGTKGQKRKLLLCLCWLLHALPSPVLQHQLGQFSPAQLDKFVRLLRLLITTFGQSVLRKTCSASTSSGSAPLNRRASIDSFVHLNLEQFGEEFHLNNNAAMDANGNNMHFDAAGSRRAGNNNNATKHIRRKQRRQPSVDTTTTTSTSGSGSGSRTAADNNKGGEGEKSEGGIEGGIGIGTTTMTAVKLRNAAKSKKCPNAAATICSSDHHQQQQTMEAQQQHEHAIGRHLSAEVLLLVLDQFDLLLQLSNANQQLLTELFRLLLHILAGHNSLQSLEHIFRMQRAFVRKFPHFLFAQQQQQPQHDGSGGDDSAEATTHCSLLFGLCLQLLRHMSSALAEVREQATLSAFTLLRASQKLSKCAFHRLSKTFTLALSSLVSNAAAAGVTLNDHGLRLSLDAILQFRVVLVIDGGGGLKNSNNEASKCGGGNKNNNNNNKVGGGGTAAATATIGQQNFHCADRAEMEQLVANMAAILSDTLQLEACKDDFDMAVDLMHRIAHGYRNNPRLRMAWLMAIARKHLDEGKANNAEAGQCLLHCCAIVADHLAAAAVANQQRAGGATNLLFPEDELLPYSVFEAFEQLSDNVHEEWMATNRTAENTGGRRTVTDGPPLQQRAKIASANYVPKRMGRGGESEGGEMQLAVQQRQFSPYAYAEMVEKTALLFERAQLFELCPTVLKLVLPMHERRHANAKLIQLHTHIVSCLSKVVDSSGPQPTLASLALPSSSSSSSWLIEDNGGWSHWASGESGMMCGGGGQQTDKRCFGTYFRVRFFGARWFGVELDGQEFVCKEPAITKLAEISHRLEQFYARKFGNGIVEVIKDSNEVDASQLDAHKAYLQITYVEPHFEHAERRRRQTHVQRSYRLHRFMYATPFTLDGSRAHGTLAEQCKRKTILTVEHSFPYVKTRLRVICREQLVLTPIEVAIEDVQKRSRELAWAMATKRPGAGGESGIDAKMLQMVLQGCIGTTVNQGPLEIARVFLANADLDGDGMPRDGLQRKLRMCFDQLAARCADALLLNERLMEPGREEYQRELRKQMANFQAAMSQFGGGAAAPNGNNNKEAQVQQQVPNTTIGNGTTTTTTIVPSSSPCPPQLAKALALAARLGPISSV